MKTTILKNSNLPALLISSAILCFMGLYNGYPYLFNNDTLVYISRAFEEQVGPERPILYGLFVRYSSLESSLWLVVVVQAFLVSYVINCYFRYFVPQPNYIASFIIYIVFITFCMSGSFYASYIMPDVFTALSMACFGLLLFIRKLQVRDFIVLSILIVVSLGMHNANLYIFLILLIIAVVGFCIQPLRKIYNQADISLKRILYMFAVVIIAHVFSSAVHHHFNSNEFKSSRGGLLFFLNNLILMGIVDEYLEENCDTKDYMLCRYKNSLSNSFLWDPDSPLQKEDGWNNKNEEYSMIVSDILTTPKYLLKCIYKSGVYTIKQFFNFDAGPFKSAADEICIPNEYTRSGIRMYYPNEYQVFNNSLQNTERLSFEFLNFVQEFVFGICMLLYIITLSYSKMNIRFRVFIGFILIMLTINAWVYSTFSHSGGDRYQSHVIWLLPLPLFLYRSKYLQKSVITGIWSKVWPIKIRQLTT